VLSRLCAWAEQDRRIRAMLLYSSRADPDAPIDAYSDYDVLVIVDNIHPFYEDERWLEAFGPVLVVFRNPIAPEHGFEAFGFVTHYQDGTKIDYGFLPVGFLYWAVKQPRLVPDLDHGFRVLIDKEGLAAGLPAPTHTAYLPVKPTEKQFRAAIDTFYNNACYVAKNLRRDDLLNAKLCLDHYMKFTDLRQMLEWQVECGHGWTLRLGAHGKGLKQWVSPEQWAALEQTYVGAGIEENWQALFRTLELFRHTARDVAIRLGYAYPEALDEQIEAHLKRTKGDGAAQPPS
jgi:aminoglycoside 6-adenylyltransferase